MDSKRSCSAVASHSSHIQDENIEQPKDLQTTVSQDPALLKALKPSTLGHTFSGVSDELKGTNKESLTTSQPVTDRSIIRVCEPRPRFRCYKFDLRTKFRSTGRMKLPFFALRVHLGCWNSQMNEY